MILSIERKSVDPGIDVLAMTGRITMGSDSQTIEWNLAELLKQNHKKVVFDLANVTFLDSSGVGILVVCHAKMKKAGGSLRLAGAQGLVKEILDLTSVSKIVPSFPDASTAAQGF